MKVREHSRREIRQALTANFDDARGLAQYLMEQIQSEIALHKQFPIPNSEPALSEHNARSNFLTELEVALVQIHAALPDTLETEQTDAKVDTLKTRLEALAKQIQGSIDYFDTNTGTPGNLWRIGLITACTSLMVLLVPSLGAVAAGTISSGVIGASTLRIIFRKEEPKDE